MIRVILLGLLVPGLGGCGASPASLGLTGAPMGTPPVADSDATIGLPGVDAGTGPYTPSLVPSTGGGRYFGGD